MEKTICVCEIAETHDEKTAIEAAKQNEFKGIRVVGHWNSVGGFCCPHHGNTCGTCPENN